MRCRSVVRRTAWPQPRNARSLAGLESSSGAEQGEDPSPGGNGRPAVLPAVAGERAGKERESVRVQVHRSKLLSAFLGFFHLTQNTWFCYKNSNFAPQRSQDFKNTGCHKRQEHHIRQDQRCAASCCCLVLR